LTSQKKFVFPLCLIKYTHSKHINMKKITLSLWSITDVSNA
jgi:hypothetical protein